MPLWAMLTLICALSLAVSDTLIKRAMQEGARELFAGWLQASLAGLPLILWALATERPEIKPGFWLALGVGIPFEVWATFLYTRALRISPMSLTLPFLAFTPVFVIGTGFIFAGESITRPGALGIGLIALGSYVLNLRHAKGSFLGPIKAVLRERGPAMMLLVSLIYALTASMIKVGIVNSSPIFFGAVYFTVFSLAYAPLGLRHVRRTTGRGFRLVLLAGAVYSVMLLTHVIAVSMTEVAYMVSVKRTSLLMGVLLGYLVFREGNIRERLAGAVLMLAGFVLVVLSSG